MQLMMKRVWTVTGRWLPVARSTEELKLSRTDAGLSRRTARLLVAERMKRLIESLNGGLCHLVDQALFDGGTADGDAVAGAHTTHATNSAQAGRGGLQDLLLLDL